MADSTEEFEPLFDYSRVQPLNVVCLDDDDNDLSPDLSTKRRKVSNSIVEKVEANGKVVHIVDCEEKEGEDWLPPPPEVACDAQKMIGENSTLKELRKKKQELISLAQSAKNMSQAVEGTTLQSSLEAASEKMSKPASQRVKIVISVQDKDGLKQFRMFMDDNFERLFKMYAEKVKLDVQNLVFCFDGDKISPSQTPQELGMEDDDIIEVHVKAN
ncbi:Small ubiquitin-related modifier like [Quillaja saponaria]|uniref:Small ubiquitin-related modifier like n=1 Tax=Quillaja saponaria TaxID=32244 RepID=A0AAD7L9V6_QUISA|nr:Small ubiquitin-related modifier like [Quillaja saponaria]